MCQSVCQGDQDDDDDCDDINHDDDDDDDDVEKGDLNKKTMKETRQMENIEELLDFFLVANDETRRNVTGLMKVHTLLSSFILNHLRLGGLSSAS